MPFGDSEEEQDCQEDYQNREDALSDRIEERDLGQEVQSRDSNEKRNAPGFHSGTTLTKKLDEQTLRLLPHGTRRGNKDHRGKQERQSHRQTLTGRGARGEIVGTVAISPEGSLANKVQQPYLSPPQVVHLMADRFECGGPKRGHDGDRDSLIRW